jgi:phosphomannomutase/phosphoglucomutase
MPQEGAVADSVSNDVPAEVPAEAPTEASPAQEASPESSPAETAPPEDIEISPEIFRAYDIRGVVSKNFSVAVVREIGRAIGSEANERGQQRIVVARDGRTSSPELGDALIAGLRASGRDVIDIGVVPTPVLYFATHHLQTNSGVMLTGSHNGPEYNGLKIVLDGETLSGDAIGKIRDRITNKEFTEGQGGLEAADINADYLRTITDDIPVALGGAFKIIVDCGNGVAGQLAPQLYRAMGHDVVELYCDIDGNFPNHQPDPSQPENLQPLIEIVKEEHADLGFAFDGDGDRLGIVDGEGNIIWPDRQMMLFAKDVLSRNQGATIIFDVKCSRHLKEVIEENGGKPLMWKTGHSLIKSKMKEVDAPLAGEMSGHIFFKERWFGFDDALYAGARALEILTNSKGTPVETFAAIPNEISTPELRIPLPEKHHEKAMQIMKNKMAFEGAEITDIDGLRVDFPDGFGLVRPSNTSPCLVVRFEAENKEALERIQAGFRDLLQSVSKDLKLPF